MNLELIFELILLILRIVSAGQADGVWFLFQGVESWQS